IVTTVAGAAGPSLTPGNREIVFGDSGRNVLRTSAAPGSVVTTLNVKTDGTAERDAADQKCRPAVSKDGKRFAYVGADGSVYVRSLNEAIKVRVTPPKTDSRYTEVAFSPNGRILALTDGAAIYLAPSSPAASTAGFPIAVLDQQGRIRSLSWQ
ncbi:MAG: PD40 domain-containing protein, partial [Candidatus Riflebacteria bacterium]|nr:PD40 domain-containing protein [Candidatus Riflebacteria bacterium]